MSLSATIRRSDQGPLGNVDEIRKQLSEVFPKIQFQLIEQEPSGLAAAAVTLPIFLRLWLAIFGIRERYPHYFCHFESGAGLAIEFYFEPAIPIRRIRVTLYGRTTGADRYFERLSANTGWIVKYPAF